MRSRCFAAAVLAVLALARAGPAQSEIAVSLDRPDPFTPARGLVRVEAVVAADEEIERVAFYLDGVVMGELEKEPWLLEIDVGEENREHRFQVVAYGVSGATGSTQLTTPSVRVDDEVSVTLQQLYVTVTRGGERLLDLGRDDFAIFDEGARQRQ